MLKISFSETPSEEKWILHGQLTAQWVRELRACWKKNHRKDTKRASIVDLNEVTFIDKSGERLLRALQREGAQCTATGVYIKQVLERLAAKRKDSLLNRLGGFVLSVVVAACAMRFGAQCFAGPIYAKHIFEQLTTGGKSSVLGRFIGLFLLVVAAVGVLLSASTVNAQNTVVTGSVPSGPAIDQVLRLTLHDAVNMALRYNLGAIESGQNAQIARGQRLLALSNLLPQVSAGASETVQQVNLGTFGLNGIRTQGIPTVVGPFSYSTVDVSVSQTLFSFESIQRFRAARTAEQAAQLSYQDILDVVTLTVGNAYL